MSTSVDVLAREPTPDLSPMSADQACKECRRRKSKCDRTIPACDPCVKYRRHCLYEKHSRTPLTRRHLTEVEEKLERAKFVIAQLRAQASASASLPPKGALAGHIRRSTPETNRPERHPPTILSSVESDQNRIGSIAREEPGLGDTNQPPTQPWDNYVSHTGDIGVRGSISSSQQVRDLLEASPKDEFEWDEQETVTSNSASPDVICNITEDGNESAITDGMASLAVNEKESGYLGVASGAALLRIFATAPRVRQNSTTSRASGPIREIRHSLISQPDPTRLITDTMIDAYFAYMVATIGVWTTATSLEALDMDLFAHARSVLSFNVLEVGNITLVQALTLISNYEQKRNKPNSGYNYSGLALRVAMGLGLHKEFQNWNISPLSMEIRRRTWWSLFVFEVGATITFSRPHSWPREGVETSLPLNVDDRSLTTLSKSYPKDVDGITSYTALITQANFHIATTPIYCRVISKPPPSAEELLSMESRLIEPWLGNIPSYFAEGATTPTRYRHAHMVMKWRVRNFRIIMYRPFVIRKALNSRDHRYSESPDDLQAYDICLNQARETIASISNHVAETRCNRLEAWYALYFLFQATLIPCICLRSDPTSSAADDWKEQIMSAWKSITSLASLNSSSARCCQAISELCGQFVNLRAPHPHNCAPESVQDEQIITDPSQPQTDETFQGRQDGQFSLFWPDASTFNSSDVFMEDWTNLLRNTADEWWPNGS